MPRETMIYGGRELPITSTVSRKLSCQLDDRERVDLSAQIGALLQEIDEKKAEKKAAMDGFKAEIDKLESEFATCCETAKTGSENRMTTCFVLLDLDRCQELIVREDTRDLAEPPRTLGAKEVARRTQSPLQLGEERPLKGQDETPPAPAPLGPDCHCGNPLPPQIDLENGSEYECETCGRAYVYAAKTEDGPTAGWYYQDGRDKRSRCSCGCKLGSPASVPPGTAALCDDCKQPWVIIDGEWKLAPVDEQPAEPETPAEEPTGLCPTCEQGLAGTCPDPPKVAGTVTVCGYYEGPEVEGQQPAEESDEPPADPQPVDRLPEEFGGVPIAEATASQCGMYLQSVGAKIPAGAGMRERRRGLVAWLLKAGVSDKLRLDEVVADQGDGFWDEFGPFRGES